MRLRQCVFDLNLEHDPNGASEPSGGAAIKDPLVIERIVTHLWLSANRHHLPDDTGGLSELTSGGD